MCHEVKAVVITIHLHYFALAPRTHYATEEGTPESMLGEGQAQQRRYLKIQPEPLTGHVSHAGQEQISGGRP